MSEETSRPTCPFKLTTPYVPPRFQQGPITTALNLGPLASLRQLERRWLQCHLAP